MNDVSLRAKISHLPESVVPHLTSYLDALQAGTEGLKLNVDLADLQIPLEGEILVPVKPRFAKVDERTFDVEISAHTRRQLYPRFAGRLTLGAARANKSTLLLEGTIKIPLGPFGQSINATLFSDAAKKSLQRFLDALAHTVGERVRQEEERYARSIHLLRMP